MKDGRLPDLKAWNRDFPRFVGELFTLVGVEGTIDGVLVEVKGEPALKVSGSDVVLRLQPLKQKVHWDPERGRPQPATAAEKTAHHDLVVRWAKHSGPPPSVRIIGPLLEDPDGVPALAVRKFTFKAEKRD
ncbi:MAG: hypothetical protein U0793_24055 [Gemmataceae bacterium]